VKTKFCHMFTSMRFGGFSVFPIFLVNFSLFVLAQGVVAATITSVGIEEGSGANGYSPQNWSNLGVAKSYDLAGEKYGTAGYYQIRPMPWDPGAVSIGEAAAAGNDLGITAGSSPSLYSVPVFLESITGAAGTYVNYGGYSITRGPDGSALYRQGFLSVAVNKNQTNNTPFGNNSGHFGEAFAFTMANHMGATFRIGVAVDAVGSADYAPDYVSLYSGSTGTVFSSQLTRNGSMDMAFFDVSAAAGESFVAAVWKLTNNTNSAVAPFGLITFDTISYNFDVGSGQIQTNSVVLGGAASALVKTGDGNLVVTSSNSYGGGTTISAGTLKLQGGSVAGSITNNGNLTLSADLANSVSGTGSLTKLDDGNATLWSANTYTGATVVEAGQLRLDGSGAISSNSVVQVAAGAGFSATGNFKLTNELTIAGLTGEGEFYNANGHLTVDKALGTDTFFGTIAGNTSLTKRGDGTLALAGPSSYAGPTTIETGRLVLAHGSALGATSGGTVVASGAQLRLNATNNGFTVGNEALTLIGEGLAGTAGGALRNAAGTNTWQGKISLAADAGIGAASGTLLTLDVDSGEAIDLTGFNLTIDGGGSTQVNDGIIGTGGITKTGSGTVTLAGHNTYAGPTTVSMGQLVIVQANFTATITPADIAVTLSTTPSDGDSFMILPGSLAGVYGAPSVNPLGQGQTASFDPSTGILSVTQGATTPSFSSAYPTNNLADIAPNGLTYLVNYAFGGDSTHEAKLPEQVTSDPAQLSLVAYVRTNDPSVSVAPERGSSLTNWSSDFITTNILTDPYAPAGTEKRSYSTPVSTNNPRMFLRLKATQGP